MTGPPLTIVATGGRAVNRFFLKYLIKQRVRFWAKTTDNGFIKAVKNGPTSPKID
jgi:hypothetical protein